MSSYTVLLRCKLWSYRMIQCQQFLFLPIKYSSYNYMRLFGTMLQKEIYHRSSVSSFDRLPYKQSYTNQSRNSDFSSKPDIIPEKPTRHVKFGLIKVLAMFILGANIGGYIFKQFVNLIEDNELLKKGEKNRRQKIVLWLSGCGVFIIICVINAQVWRRQTTFYNLFDSLLWNLASPYFREWIILWYFIWH